MPDWMQWGDVSGWVIGGVGIAIALESWRRAKAANLLAQEANRIAREALELAKPPADNTDVGWGIRLVGPRRWVATNTGKSTATNVTLELPYARVVQLRPTHFGSVRAGQEIEFTAGHLPAKSDARDLTIRWGDAESQAMRLP